jgi:penicillin-binding protein-related factor A (putative recombinase)
MSTPEGKVKDRIKKVLKASGAYYHMPLQNGMGGPTLDFICCYNGMYFAIEAKAPDGKITLRQQHTIQQMRDAGAVVFVVYGDTHELENWLGQHLLGV